jgi:hypothetical protein
MTPCVRALHAVTHTHAPHACACACRVDYLIDCHYSEHEKRLFLVAGNNE